MNGNVPKLMTSILSVCRLEIFRWYFWVFVFSTWVWKWIFSLLIRSNLGCCIQSGMIVLTEHLRKVVKKDYSNKWKSKFWCNSYAPMVTLVTAWVNGPMADVLSFTPVVCCIFQLQSVVRMWLARKKHRERLQYFKDNVSSPITSQCHK